jgi:hypothetical protein
MAASLRILGKRWAAGISGIRNASGARKIAVANDALNRSFNRGDA